MFRWCPSASKVLLMCSCKVLLIYLCESSMYLINNMQAVGEDHVELEMSQASLASDDLCYQNLKTTK